jgi:hypothetical protein
MVSVGGRPEPDWRQRQPFLGAARLTRLRSPVAGLFLRVTRIVRWIDVFDLEWPFAADLQDRFRRRPGVMLHPCGLA